MRARIINEGISDILPGKSKKEVADALAQIEVNKALYYCIKHKDVDGVLASLNRGANDSYSSGNHYNYKSVTEILNSFIVKNKDEFFKEKPSTKFLNDLLKRSAQTGFIDMAKFALEKGADINYRDSFLNSPLYYAAKQQEFNTVKFLVESGADLEIENKDGFTPLLVTFAPATVQSGIAKAINRNIIWYLIDKGADYTKKTKVGGNIYSYCPKGALLNEMLDKLNLVPTNDNILHILHNGTIRNIEKLINKGYLDLNKKISYKNYHSWDNKTSKPMLPIDHIMIIHNDQGPGKMKLLLKYNSPKPSKKTIEDIKIASRERDSAARGWRKFLYDDDILNLNESKEDIFKPKSTEELKKVIEEYTQEVLLELLDDKAIAVTKDRNKLSVGTSTLDLAFDRANRQFGPGMYIACDSTENPLKNIFPIKRTNLEHMGYYIYPIPRADMEFAIRELVTQTIMKSKHLQGFHIKYFNPVNESVNDIFKPKSTEDFKDIIEKYTNDVLYELIDGDTIYLFKLSNRLGINKSLIDHVFHSYNEDHGPGLYVYRHGGSLESHNDPLKNIFPSSKAGGHIFIYRINRTEMEFAIKELVTQTIKMSRKLDGFHIKYFDDINESRIFKPKSYTDIIDDLTNIILSEYDKYALHFSNISEYGEEIDYPDLYRHSGDQFTDLLFKKYGHGIFVHIDEGDDMTVITDDLIELGIDYERIGLSTLIVDEDDNERRLIRKFCYNLINHKITRLMIRKFSER